MATRLIGTLLNLKPLVQINHETGLVEACSQSRTRGKSIDSLYETFFNKIDKENPLHLAVLHGNALQEAEELVERIQRKHAPKELLMNITGPVLGIHTGPRALAMCGYTED